MNRLLLVALLCAACHTATTPQPGKTSSAGGDLQVQVVRLEHTQARDAAKVVEESLAGRSANGVGFKVAVQTDQNALVLSGTTAQIREALEVIAKVDSRPER